MEKLVPRVLSLASRKNAGCDWSRGMCVNKLRGGGRSSNRSFTKSCGLEDHEILSGVGRRFPLQNSALLSASYDNT